MEDKQDRAEKIALPKFITFTGIDEKTSIDELKAIASKYPVEFGVLVSSERQWKVEEQRYPKFQWIGDILVHEKTGLRLAAHVCGEMAKQITRQGQHYWEGYAKAFDRIQINVAEPKLSHILRAAAFGAEVGRPVIFQARQSFPDRGSVQATVAQWLFDKSGGRGEVPQEWIKNYDGPDLIGFAGGITPDNVAQIVEHISQNCMGYAQAYCRQSYWIDMESGVRTDDWFDTAKVRAVCEAVYGTDYRQP